MKTILLQASLEIMTETNLSNWIVLNKLTLLRSVVVDSLTWSEEVLMPIKEDCFIEYLLKKHTKII